MRLLTTDRPLPSSSSLWTVQEKNRELRLIQPPGSERLPRAAYIIRCCFHDRTQTKTIADYRLAITGCEGADCHVVWFDNHGAATAVTKQQKVTPRFAGEEWVSVLDPRRAGRVENQHYLLNQDQNLGDWLGVDYNPGARTRFFVEPIDPSVVEDGVRITFRDAAGGAKLVARVYDPLGDRPRAEFENHGAVTLQSNESPQPHSHSLRVALLQGEFAAPLFYHYGKAAFAAFKAGNYTWEEHQPAEIIRQTRKVDGQSLPYLQGDVSELARAGYGDK